MRIVDVRCRPSYPGFRELFRPSWAKERLGAPVVEYIDSRDEFVALLDAEGIELCVVTGRDQTSRDGRAFKNAEIAALGAQYPTRIIGMAGVDTGIGVRKMLACMWKHPNVYIEGSLYLGQPGTLVLAENPTMLAERFMFGSGYPVVPIGWMKQQYDKLGLSGDAADRMWWRNALTLFGRLT